AAIASIRAHVDEICIVDTGSTDGTAEAAARLADRFEVFTACNFPDGEIADFSAARNRSFALASHDIALWVDADDTVEGLEHLRDAIMWCDEQAKGQPWRALFPYDYEQDAEGRCTSWQPRERVVWPKAAFHWVYRVHETLTAIQPTEWRTLEPAPSIVWRHHMDRKKPRSRRNLRILRSHVANVGFDRVDIKTQLDFGAECAKAGEHAAAIQWLTRFVEGCDLVDERVLACLHLIHIYAFWPGNEAEAERWAHRVIDLAPSGPDGYFALARLAYKQAGKGGDRERRHLQRAAHFARKGLSMPVAKTRTVTNPQDAGTYQAMLFDACKRLGDSWGALKAARACLGIQPNNVGLKLHVAETEHRLGIADLKQRIDVAILCGVTQEAWDPGTVASHGIGGSETAVVEMAKRLVRRGARVRVFCRCEAAGLYDGVEYRPMSDADEAEGCDLLIAWRNGALLETAPAKVKWLWLHDTEAAGASAWNLALADRVLCLSAWHAGHIAERYPAVADRITVTRNGIDPARFERTDILRNPHKAIYSSSPTRGLRELACIWRLVRAEVPDAELHAFYGWAGVDKATRESLEADIAQSAGIQLHDRVNQHKLADEMLGAGVWVHPSWCGDAEFTETSCVGAMEAQAAGCFIVAGASGALCETVLHGVLVAGDKRDARVQADFAKAIVRAMGPESFGDRLRRPTLAAEAKHAFAWNAVADEWMAMITKDVRAAPVVKLARDARPTIDFVLAPRASGDVVMDACSPGGEPVGGGSRIGFLGLVQAFARRGGWRVRALSTFEDPLVIRDGVEYVRLDRMRTAGAPDVAFAFYDTSPLPHYDGRKTLRIASHHTYVPYLHFDSADVNTAPSDAAVDYLRDRYDPTGVWYTLPNGCDAPKVARAPVAGRILYHTSPDRGLHHLLEAYPRIKARVPHASLHIVGEALGYLKGGPRDRAGRTAAALDAAKALGGVRLLGRLPRADLEQELAAASVFAYPCDPVAPCETFSLSLMECCALGLPVVLRPADALESIYKGSVFMVDAFGDAFADAVARVLTDDALAGDLSVDGRRLAERFTFDRQAAALAEILRTHLERTPGRGRMRMRIVDRDGAIGWRTTNSSR
ncbi:MAG: glycosyltransferase, partial [Polyangiaceae bacterium]|nr:glycosyltransferase [Polyangiaceae bacterium]